MKIHKLRDLLLIKNGKDHSVLSDGKIPVYGSGGIMRYANKSIYNDESILLPRKGTLSNIQYVNKPFWSVDTIYYTIVNKDLADPFFLFNYLKSLDLSNLNTGTGVPSMTFESYYNLEIKLPSISIQKQISAVLSSLDSKIELNNRINAELEQMAKTIYDYWFVQFDFPISAEYAASIGQPQLEGKPYNSSGGKMVWSGELKREVPEGWEVKKLEDLGTIVGGSTPSRDIDENFSNNGMPWITPKDLSLNAGNKFIKKGEIDVSDLGLKSASLTVMPKGTVLMSSRAPVGYLAISRNEVTTNQGFKSFIPNKGVCSEFIFYSIKNLMPVIENNASGSTFKEISTSVLKNIKDILPASEVINRFEVQVKTTFRRQELIETENQKLTELRDWLLPMLMNGQVMVVDMVDEGVMGMAAEAVEEYIVRGE